MRQKRKEEIIVAVRTKVTTKDRETRTQMLSAAALSEGVSSQERRGCTGTARNTTTHSPAGRFCNSNMASSSMLWVLSPAERREEALLLAGGEDAATGNRALDLSPELPTSVGTRQRSSIRVDPEADINLWVFDSSERVQFTTFIHHGNIPLPSTSRAVGNNIIPLSRAFSAFYVSAGGDFWKYGGKLSTKTSQTGPKEDDSWKGGGGEERRRGGDRRGEMFESISVSLKDSLTGTACPSVHL
ncbi:hypothetical protein EYF80_035629 [Liparis tanakae]|uniref:Uncharacterized protein n=1 Tax=Liparis tanakae TaxID=230148 RepID=A0A4Z2GKU3_9TELE|nr:hypothetical protein EYF80_035629 [Liparis tanakae]